MIHVETKNGIGSTKIKGNTTEIISEFTSITHMLREDLEEKLGEKLARAMLEGAFKLAFDNEKMQECLLKDEGIDGGVQ